MDKEKRSGRAYDLAGTRRRICGAIAILLFLAGLTALIVYLVYRPHKPQFSVIGAAVYNLNTSAPPLVSATMQFTIAARNPNRRVSIYYDRLSAYVSYRNQAITLPLALPPLHQGKRTTVAVSPVLGGTAVPVAADVANGLAVDEAYGVVGLMVVVMGRLRWKAGAIRTGHYGLYVRCDVMVGLKGAMGQPPLLGSSGCKVDT
ncbi:hypothetical protein SAY86_015067 [Trapa natans]|uniref:Late embryogenesis abundant protein LEA-2 subgroup domain-containing protein n=1 Tax=Trapa natans TaxID=22666 RepID=A0AAN7KQL2_TRANT|nr:hypothetical protein SAY86_015067 [Trapa natans]